MFNFKNLPRHSKFKHLNLSPYHDYHYWIVPSVLIYICSDQGMSLLILKWKWVVTRLTRRVPLVEQVQFTLPEHQSSPPSFSGVRVTQSLVWCVCFVDRCLSFCPFSFGHCVVCPSIYGFCLLLWYLQTLKPIVMKYNNAAPGFLWVFVKICFSMNYYFNFTHVSTMWRNCL